jgi:hypothetical protein
MTLPFLSIKKSAGKSSAGGPEPEFWRWERSDEIKRVPEEFAKGVGVVSPAIKEDM